MDSMPKAIASDAGERALYPRICVTGDVVLCPLPRAPSLLAPSPSSRPVVDPGLQRRGPRVPLAT